MRDTKPNLSDPDSFQDNNSQVYGDDDLTFDLKHMENERCHRSASGSHSYIVVDGIYYCICCGTDGGEV